MKSVEIFTDGACSGNPGPGGWGAILKYGEIEKEISGGEAMTTNNRMELIAAIEALSLLKEPCAVNLYSDSLYLVNSVSKGWLFAWEKADFKKKGKNVPNTDLWQRLLPLIRQHDVNFIWVKGHAENPYNNRCDEMAVNEWKRIKG